MTTRSEWLHHLEQLVRVPLNAAARGTLRASIPTRECDTRERSQPLETMGRIFAGIAPWLADDGTGNAAECALREEFRGWFLRSLPLGCDPEHPDFWGFGLEEQSLVDAAFLAQGFVRAPSLLDALDSTGKNLLAEALASTRRIKPSFNNWLLFSATVEACLRLLEREADPMRIDLALRQHEQWYVGDGVYGDGPDYHADYYNSFVIQPMLMDVLEVFSAEYGSWGQMAERMRPRLTRYAEQQERMIAADGSWPPLGRSITYRCGAFSALATAAWKGLLPTTLPPSQVRCALTATLRRSLNAPGTVDEDGWLRVGLCGHQPSLGESYISVPSQYLCCFVFPVLGLAPEAPFWAEPDQPWTQVRIWENGEDLPPDHAMR